MYRVRTALWLAMVVGWGAIAPSPMPCAAQTLDTMLKLGFLNTSDEAAHNVSVSSGSLTGGAYTLGQSSRVVTPSQDVYFDIAVDPAAQNYITTRLYSDSVNDGVSVPGRTLVGTSTGGTVNWGQLDDSSSAGMLEDHWHYATVPLPLSMTSGQSTVRLSLYGLDNSSSWQITPPSPTTHSQNTRSVYALFSHTNPHFEVPDAVSNGTVYSPYDFGDYVQPSSGEIASYVSNLTNIANGIATQVAGMQVTDTTGLPSALLGAFDIRTGSTDTATLNATHAHHIATDNLGPLRGATILAHSYNMPGGVYEGNSSILQRIAWGIDYARRAQGATGGYVDVWSPVEWTGGPNRTDASGSLEGITHQEIAKAFLMTYPAMESAGLLDELIDDDNDSRTRPIARREAYEDLFREFVDFHSGYFGGWNGSDAPRDYGHAPNQDLYQVGGLAWAMEALETLTATAFDPDPATSHANAQDVLKTRAYQAAGITKTPLYDSWWFSPAGLPLEDRALMKGGFSSEYGQRQSEEIWDIAQFLDDPADQAPLIEMAAKSADLWQHFWYPIYNSAGAIDTRLEGAINWRNSKISGASEQWFPAQFAALSADGIEDPDVIRMLQLAYLNDELHIAAPRGGHFWQDGVWIMEQVDQLQTLLADLPSTSDLAPEDQRLPFEAGQPDFAWIDSFGGAVAIRHGDDFIYMALNWKHDSSGSDPLTNDIVRIHEITPEDGRVVAAYMENPTGDFGELYRVEYGSYLVGINADDLTSYMLNVPTADGWLPDLVSGNLVEISGGQLLLTPGQSVVLLLDELTTPLPGDFNDDGVVNAADYTVWRDGLGTEYTEADYIVWREHYGQTAGSGGGQRAATVPEPATWMMLICGALAGAAYRRLS